MRVRLLTEAEFRVTFLAPMREVSATATDVLDIWPYVGAVPAEDLVGHEVWVPLVEAVYRTGDGRFDHVLVITRTRNVYLVVVVDLQEDAVHGHYLLDLNRRYGLDEPGAMPDHDRRQAPPDPGSG